MADFNAEIPTVLVDMDGVLADFDNEIFKRIAEHHPSIPLVDRTNFYISDDYPQFRKKIKSLSDEEGFFESLPLVQGAIEGWQRILDCGFNPRICSSPISTNPRSSIEKLNWLEQHFVPVFGGWVVEQAIITKCKDEFSGIALIDDRPEIKNDHRTSWQHIVFDRPYNQHVIRPRLKGWSDTNLDQLLQSALNQH